MSKKKKKDRLQDLSTQELEARLRESREHSFKMKFQHATNPLKNPMEIRQARREIARLLTLLHKKEKVA